MARLRGRMSGLMLILALTMVFTVVTLSDSTAEAFGSFWDDDGSPHESNIEAIAAAAITNGCGNGAYCPEASVTRGQMASFLVRALGLTATDGTTFTDVSGHPHQADIEKLGAAGITNGCGNGAYCPDAAVSRAEMATFLARALQLTSGSGNTFSDDDGMSHESNIEAIAAAGITNGCGNALYCPWGAVTRAQAASFLARGLGLEPISPTRVQERRDDVPISTTTTTTAAAARPVGEYGVDESSIGPGNEPATTSGIQVTSSNFASKVQSARPGDVLLLRAGFYASDVTVPAGSSGSPIVLKPYNGESVTLTGEIRLSSHNVLAGVTIDRSGQYGLLIDQNSSDPKTNIEIRYCNIFGGSTDGVRLQRNVRNIEIHHCTIDGGKDHHSLLSYSASSSWAPTNIELHHNVFTKERTGGGAGEGASEDGLQLNGWGYHHIHHNNFRDIPGENGIDIKPPHGAATVDVEHNYFDGASIYGAMFTIQAGSGATQNWRNNHFDGSSGSPEIHAALFGDNLKERATFEWNVFTDINKRYSFRMSDRMVIRNNLFEGGTLRLGQSSGPDPENLSVSSNRFVGVMMDRESNVTFAESVDNELVNVGGDWSGIGEGSASVPSSP